MTAAQNHLIELLPRKERVRLLVLCEPVELVHALIQGPGSAWRVRASAFITRNDGEQ